MEIKNLTILNIFVQAQVSLIGAYFIIHTLYFHYFTQFSQCSHGTRNIRTSVRYKTVYRRFDSSKGSRFRMERPRVISSVYSSSFPTATPREMVVMRSSNGESSLYM